MDRAIYSAVAATPTPALDEPLRRLSNAANNSRLWLAIAAGLAVTGGRAGRRAAVRGTLAIGVTSALVNLEVKTLWSRRRPDRASAGVPEQRDVRMPTSTSFPSGHTASGFAFASAVGRDQPWLGLALRILAAAVGYSRVHTGVHYPGDVVAGASDRREHRAGRGRPGGPAGPRRIAPVDGLIGAGSWPAPGVAGLTGGRRVRGR